MNEPINLKQDKPRGLQKINIKILNEQRRLADYLNLKCRDISPGGQMALLITFSVLISAALLRLIISAIQ